MHIAIIGAGSAGLAAAWLLESHHKITLFEKSPRLGGHADTVDVQLEHQDLCIDAGFDHFSAEMFPTFTRLLAKLDVPTHTYPMSASMAWDGSDDVTVLPPVRGGLPRWAGLRPAKLAELLQFRRVLKGAKALMKAKDSSITISDYVDSLGLNQRFQDHFLYPFLLGSWCVEPSELRGFSAYNVLRYAFIHQVDGLKHFQWLDIAGGTRVYIQRLAKSLQRTTVRTATEVRSICRTPTGYEIADSTGNIALADHVIMATNAYEAASILKEVRTAEPAVKQLKRFEYFRTEIAIHGDRRWMPPDARDWSVFNLRHEGRYTHATVWKPWRTTGLPVFKSWVTFKDEPPETLYAQASYWHGRITPEYFAAQRALAELQGEHQLWFAGVYTHDVDCHESAILSAVKVARRLAPESSRLAQLGAASGVN
jgi:predicted NAD/FAD-binding protein